MTTTPALPLLDELDELRAKATPGPWMHVDHVGGSGTVPVVVAEGYGFPAECGDMNGTADAALIVAAVSAVPQLTAALRAVLALAEELEREAGERERRAERTPGSAPFAADRIRLFTGARHQRLAAAQLRTVITTALEAS